MVTSIQISEDLREELQKRKLAETETYEEVIWDLLEDSRELSDETKKSVARARAEVKEGKTSPLADVKRALGL